MSNRIHKDNWIKTDQLPHKKGIGANSSRMVIDWEASAGYTIDFYCVGEIGKITILEYIKEKRKVKININNEEHIVNTDTIINCQFGRNIFKKENLNYKYKVGEEIQTNNTIYEVLAQTRDENTGKKMYQLMCLQCGEIVFKTENQINYNYGCAVCSGHKVKRGLNDIWTVSPELGELLENKFNGYVYSVYSSQKVNFICPICGEVVKQKIIGDVYRQGLCCPVCGITKSYPNRFMYALLKNLNADFKDEKIFDWSDNKRYDFYLNTHNIVIEMMGKQHYDKDFFATCEEVKENDKYKKDLALSNGILFEDYLEIDARYSDFEYIKSNVINSKLSDIFDLSSVDWNEVECQISINPLKKACKLWDEGNHDIPSIANIIGYHQSTTSEFLRKGAKMGITTYTTRISKLLGDEKSRQTWYQRFGQPFKCDQNGLVFGSPTVFENVSESIFGYKISDHAPLSILSGKQKDTKKDHLTFSYITREEFNKIKQEYPEQAFGDAFENLIPQVRKKTA